MDPNRPSSPVANNNRGTRPEAVEFAEKNKGTNDWYRHDGKSVESPTPPPPSRLGKSAKAIADKYKGDSEEWYGHNNSVNGSVNGFTPVPRPKKCTGVARCNTPDARKNYEKIKGVDEAWYKHDENQNFSSPRPRSRLHGRDATDMKNKSVGSGSEWYKHTHTENGYSPPKPKSRAGSALARDNQTKMRPMGTPVWASYDQNGSVDDTDSRPQSRLKGDAVDYQERNKGSASDWYKPQTNGHSETPESVLSPRRGSEESQKYAEKSKGESGNWFNHDANRHYNEPMKQSRCRSASARDMIEKTRGHELERVMHHDMEPVTQNGHDPRIKPEAAEFAHKSVQGMMSKYMQTNGSYSSPRPGPRVKPEAVENAAKNRGYMSEMMEGYPDTPKKHGVRRITPEAEKYAERNRGTASMTISGELPMSARKPRVQGDAAQKYADRNYGTKNLLNNMDELRVSGTPIKHRSAEASANAARWQGNEITSIFNHN